MQTYSLDKCPAFCRKCGGKLVLTLKVYTSSVFAQYRKGGRTHLYRCTYTCENRLGRAFVWGHDEVSCVHEGAEDIK